MNTPREAFIRGRSRFAFTRSVVDFSLWGGGLWKCVATFLLTLALFSYLPKLHADGGLVVLRGTAEEGTTAALFVSPVPLRAGSADLSVLLTGPDGAPRLDRAVILRLIEPEGSADSVAPACCRMGAPPPVQEVAALIGAGGNRWLYEARVRLPKPGRWQVGIEWENGAVAGTIEVQPPAPPLAAHWPWFLIPVGGALFLGLNAAARHARQPSGLPLNGS